MLYYSQLDFCWQKQVAILNNFKVETYKTQEMKTITLIKQFAFSMGIVAGMNAFTSCNSCDRKTQTTTTTESTVITDEDTVSTDEASSTVNDGTTTSTSINATGSGTGKKPASTSTSSANSSSTSSSATSAKNEAARQQAITDRIENSDVNNAVDKNGNPLRSGGNSGSGSGTGTGSTGNNSKVTTREAQRTN